MNSSKKAKVAIIGLGNLGSAVASNLIVGNREVIIADIVFTRATRLSNQLGDLAVPMYVDSAIKQADILVLALHFTSIKEFLSENAMALNGKIIVDPSNPIMPDDNNGFIKIIGQDESSGQILSSLLPQGAKIAKAFGTLGVASLSKAAHHEPSFVQFYAIDDQSLSADIEELIRDNGFEPVHIGGMDQSIRIEVFGDLNEFGAISKPVTIEEAKSRL
ncbi:NADPH-dependent F420 reductase [Flavobacterium sp. 2]|uniref:NADPH-dependent F420 reductase n=1 Tax=Flavobacterium sp. 2 TaxID=308053 RepID=UPI000C191B69|nr:NAD(P)-binding domain-containing protein [Flavobacterium sp. 2]PIF71302.1 hypothetical protein CLU99_2067 [Flavobacterium sp. 2]